jgi:predicted nuclease of predicted toxin-antitoxin system
MLAGYADENVNPRIVAGLRRHGMDIVSVRERGQFGTDDEVLLNMATAEGRLVLTSDTDFLRIHSRWMSTGRSHAGIVFWAQNLTIGYVIRRVLSFTSQTAPANAANAVRFL